MDLQGKVALATGSGRGLGLAFATQLAQAGAAVVVNDVDQAADVTGQCIGLGGDKLALWSHPHEKRIANRSGGWTAEAIAEAWRTAIGQEPESYGVELPS